MAVIDVARSGAFFYLKKVRKLADLSHLCTTPGLKLTAVHLPSKLAVFGNFLTPATHG